MEKFTRHWPRAVRRGKSLFGLGFLSLLLAHPSVSRVLPKCPPPGLLCLLLRSCEADLSFLSLHYSHPSLPFPPAATSIAASPPHVTHSSSASSLSLTYMHLYISVLSCIPLLPNVQIVGFSFQLCFVFLLDLFCSFYLYSNVFLRPHCVSFTLL